MNSNGPTAPNGTLLTPQTEGTQSKVQYVPEEQTWVDVLDKEKNVVYSVGCWNNSPPTPIDLVRKKPLSGELLEINGNKWIIPVLHPQWTTVPRTFVKTADGITEKFKREYQEICARAEEIRGREKEEWFWKDLVDFTADVLAINYRVTDWEAIDILELLDTNTVCEIAGIALGYTSLAKELETQKKTNTPTDG